jgi:hypothetical protein
MTSDGHFTILIPQLTTPIGYSVSNPNQRADLTTAVHFVDSPAHDPLLFGRFNGLTFCTMITAMKNVYTPLKIRYLNKHRSCRRTFSNPILLTSIVHPTTSTRIIDI